MKTLLYNPIFVNPQAYYVFPNLSRVQTQEVDSTKEPANYIGTIEVKTIAYGDTNKVQTFTNTSEIDLVNFSNEWVRISLYTILGSVILGEWKLGNFEQEEPEEPPYIEPDVLASLCGVWIADQNTNESPTRNIIKNKLKDRGGDFEILNAAYSEGSGYKNGAFVTDGVDDLIVSQKPVSEMLGGSNKITVVSMIHQITKEPDDYTVTNIIKQGSRNYIRNKVEQIYKTGIYGYSLKGNTTSNINILGDKNDYSIEYSMNDVLSGNFSVVGAIMEDNSIVANSSIAYYWTFIANKALTEDQINQIIEYFNLDKYVAPDIYYNVKKQGLTNENHAQFGDKLIDYSGNGHDMQLYNIGWGLDSGVGKYPVNFDDWIPGRGIANYVKLSGSVFKIVSDLPDYPTIIFGHSYYVNPSFTISVKGLPDNGSVFYTYDGDPSNPTRYNIVKDGIYQVPKTISSLNIGNFIIGNTRLPTSAYTGLTIEVLPEYEGALVLDGVNDYGKVERLPILKDYTIVADRDIFGNADNNAGGVFSKSHHHSLEGVEYGAFIFEMSSNNYSFNINPTKFINYNKTRTFSYLSKYLYNGETVYVGTATDSNSMWLGTIRDKDPRFSNLAFYSAMIFPYSLSKFLIERQLKRYKAGSFYEKGAVLFRPLISSNTPYKEIEIYDFTGDKNNGLLLSNSIDKSGTYLPEDNKIAIFIKPNGVDEVSTLIVNGDEYKSSGININGFYQFYVKLTKSPQVIDITIDEYIRFEDIKQTYPALVTFSDKTFGDKLKVGEEYIFQSKNILPELYTYRRMMYRADSSNMGIYIDEGEKIKITKQLSFILLGKKYLLDNDQPKCILSPELLKIPNSSYEYLGYIPDISGHGNHGYIYNSAYNETSGMNEDGSFKLDGVNDFIKLDTLSTGGQQVFIKTLWSSTPALLYDQRYQGNSGFAILTLAKDTPNNDVIAYKARNINGSSYIDGVLNKHIETYTLQDVVHNITITNNKDTNSQSPIIGKSSYNNSSYTKMALYTFMLFDKISSPKKIKELNEIIGVNPIVEAPPYYYDTYGKTNDLPDRDVLINMGTGGSHDLKLLNFGFNGEDGYCDATFGDYSWNVVTVNRYYSDNKVIINDVEPIYDHSINQYNDCIWGKWLTQYQNPRPSEDVPSFYTRFSGIPQGGSIAYLYVKEDGIVDKKIMNENDVYYLLPASYNTRYKEVPDAMQAARMGFYAIRPWESSLPLTIEICKGLITDRVDSTLRNTTIPALTDFTCVVKRETIGEQSNNSIFMFKGSTPTAGGKSNAFLYDYKSAGINNVFSFGQANGVVTNSPISYITKTLCDDRIIIPGDGVDTTGLMIGKWDTWWKGAFYKLMLYPKTLDILQINMLKNLFELDGLWYFKDGAFPKLYEGVDFTKLKVFPLSKDKISITFTQTSMHITKLSLVANANVIEVNIPEESPFNSYKVRVSNLPTNIYLRYTYATSREGGRHVTLKNGINIIPRTHPMFSSSFGMREGFGFTTNVTGTFDVDILIELIN